MGRWMGPHAGKGLRYGSLVVLDMQLCAQACQDWPRKALHFAALHFAPAIKQLHLLLSPARGRNPQQSTLEVHSSAAEGSPALGATLESLPSASGPHPRIQQRPAPTAAMAVDGGGGRNKRPAKAPTRVTAAEGAPRCPNPAAHDHPPLWALDPRSGAPAPPTPPPAAAAASPPGPRSLGRPSPPAPPLPPPLLQRPAAAGGGGGRQR